MPYVALPGSKLSKTTAESKLVMGQPSRGSSFAQKQHWYVDQRNAYLTRLSGSKPGMAIDALKDDVRHKEKQNKELTAQLVATDDFLLKTKEQVEETFTKTQSALRDRQELYRDLATFEFNFSKRNQQELFVRIDTCDTMLNEFMSHFREKGYLKGKRGWLSI